MVQPISFDGVAIPFHGVMPYPPEGHPYYPWFIKAISIRHAKQWQELGFKTPDNVPRRIKPDEYSNYKGA